MFSLLRYLWAGPNSLVGLLALVLAHLSGGGSQRHSGVIEVWGGIPAWLLRNGTLVPGGVSAMTLGHVVLGIDQKALHKTRVHERVHVEQYGRWGIFFLPAYGLSSAFALLNGRDAYRDNAFERVAYDIERKYNEAVQRDSFGPRA